MCIVQVEQHWLYKLNFHLHTYSVITGGELACNNIGLFPCSVVTIGFNPAAYTVAESAGNVNVTVNILNGTLGRDVHVLLTYLTDGTAIGI